MSGQKRRQPTQHQIDTIRANTVKDAAKLLGISPSTIYDICRDSKIEPIWVRKSASLQNWGTVYREINDLWSAGDVSIYALCEKYALRPSDVCGKLGLRSPMGAAKYLTKHEFTWLEHSCPEGMGVNEYIASFVRDAYLDEVK